MYCSCLGSAKFCALNRCLKAAVLRPATPRASCSGNVAFVTGDAVLGCQRVPQALRVLLLDSNDLSSAGDAAGQSLLRLLASAPRLSRLSLSDCALGPTAAAALAAGLCNAPSLTALSLAACQLDQAAVEALAATVRAGARLEELNLSENAGVGDAAVVALAAAAPAVLARLDLSATAVGPSCVVHLATLGALKRLDLFNTRLGDEGAAALAACLSAGGQFAALEELNIAGCDIGPTGAGALFTALAAAPQVATVEMGANPATQDDGFEALLERLREARPDLDVHWRVGDSGVREGRPPVANGAA